MKAVIKVTIPRPNIPETKEYSSNIHRSVFKKIARQHLITDLYYKRR